MTNAPTNPPDCRHARTRSICGMSLCAGEWPREALLDGMRATCDYDDARDDDGRLAAAMRLEALAARWMPGLITIEDGAAIAA